MSRTVPKTGKQRRSGKAKSGPVDAKRVTTQRRPSTKGYKPSRPNRIDDVPAQRIKKPINFMGKRSKIRKALRNGGFPDLSGDGKVTQKDILMGRGVIKKNKGGKVMPGKLTDMRQIISMRKKTSQRVANLNNRYMSSKYELPPVKMEHSEEFLQRIKEERKEINEARRKEKMRKMIADKKWKAISNEIRLKREYRKDGKKKRPRI